MKRRFAIALVLGLAAASTAHAGKKETLDITITKQADGSGIFKGALGSVRNSSSTTSYVMCGTLITDLLGFAYCSASNGTTTATCMAKVTALADLIQKLKSDDYIQVNFNAAGECTTVQVVTSSTLAPKAH
jgi:hypothetical protein